MTCSFDDPYQTCEFLFPGEVRSPEPSNPYVMRSRFDSSDQSEEEEEINQVPSQQGHPLYNDELEEEIGASPVNSPPPPPPEEAGRSGGGGCLLGYKGYCIAGNFRGQNIHGFRG